MKLFLKILAGIFGIVLLFIGVVAYLNSRPVIDGRTPEAHRQIAEACLGILPLHFSPGDEIKPDDTRIPAVIHALHPTTIVTSETDVVIMRDGKPSEYHFILKPDAPKTCILYVAGSGYWGHREIFRMRKE